MPGWSAGPVEHRDVTIRTTETWKTGVIVSTVMVFVWLAFLALVAYGAHRRGGVVPEHEAPGRSEPAGAGPVYLPDIGYFDSELEIYFDPELGYSDIVIPETVPPEWVDAYGT